jgi:hypothetical protein
MFTSRPSGPVSGRQRPRFQNESGTLGRHPSGRRAAQQGGCMFAKFWHNFTHDLFIPLLLFF